MTSEDPRPAEDPRPTAERLREVASELFAERGYAGTSLAEIASRLGIRKPSLYNYHASKAELFLSLFQESLEAWRTASRPHLGGPGNCRGRLRRHLHSLVDFARHEPYALALCRVAVGGTLDDVLTEQVHALVERQRGDYRLQLREFFREAVDGGEVIEEPIPVLVLAWETFLDGLFSAPLLGLRPALGPPIPIAPPEDLESLWRIFWRGLARETE